MLLLLVGFAWRAGVGGKRARCNTITATVLPTICGKDGKLIDASRGSYTFCAGSKCKRSDAKKCCASGLLCCCHFMPCTSLSFSVSLSHPPRVHIV